MRLLAWIFVLGVPLSVSAQEPTLADSYRKWHAGLSSANKEDQEKALRQMSPNKDDVVYMFPKASDKLWPLLEKNNELMLRNLDKIAKEFASKGKITKIEEINIRKDKLRSEGSYKRLLTVIPQEAPIFSLIVQHDQGSSGSGSYFFRNGRWVWIRGMEVIPELLDKLSQ